MARTKEAISSNQSTEKALNILEYLAESGKFMRMIDIAHALDINSSTVNRFLSALINCGYVEQDAETLRYGLTYKVCRLGNMVANNRDAKIQRITHPYLEKVSGEFNESSCISLERNMQMVYVDVFSGYGQALLARQRVGNTAPMHATGNGKLCLLNYSESQIDEYIVKRGLTRFTEHTIVTKDALMNKLDTIRRDGYACDEEECEIGMRCLAYPLYDYTSRIIGGISITGPATRLTPEVLLSKHHYLKEAAEAISERLGYKQGLTEIAEDQ